MVAPRAGAWIEIVKFAFNLAELKSLPVRERGLKSLCLWILFRQSKSLPVRERGLKLPCQLLSNIRLSVAPRAGAWIEIIK